LDNSSNAGFRGRKRKFSRFHSGFSSLIPNFFNLFILLLGKLILGLEWYNRNWKYFQFLLRDVESVSEKKITIRDIARDCGVGLGTVSRVVNRQPGVKDEIRRKVLQYIEDIGWRCDKLQHLTGYDDDIIFTWHFYIPGEFTHQRGVLQASYLYYNRVMPYPGDIAPYNGFYEFVNGEKDHYQGYSRMDKNFLRDAMAPAFEFAEQHPERIVWCGEFGTIRHCPLEYRENYMADVIALLREHHTPYCSWNYLSTPNDGNRFSLVDDDNRRILSRRMADILVGKGC